MATSVKIGDRAILLDGQPGRVIVSTKGLFGELEVIGTIASEAELVALVVAVRTEGKKSFPGFDLHGSTSAGRPI
jgi:hypothetical protein